MENKQSILTSALERLIIGSAIIGIGVGLGGGLIVSVFMRVPKE